MSSLYVGDLHADTTEAMLYEMFSKVGHVMSIHMCRNTTTNSLGYAYVNFKKPADAELAYDTMNYELINGWPIRIMWTQYNGSLRRSGQGNVFIKNLDASINTKMLHDTFSVFGNILSCKVALNENGESKGFGFIHFDTVEAAQAAIIQFNGTIWKQKRVYASNFISRKTREQQIASVLCPMFRNFHN